MVCREILQLGLYFDCAYVKQSHLVEVACSSAWCAGRPCNGVV